MNLILRAIVVYIVLGLCGAFTSSGLAANDSLSQSEIIDRAKTRVVTLLQEGQDIYKLTGQNKIDTVAKFVQDYIDYEFIADFALSKYKNLPEIKNNPALLVNYREVFRKYIISWLAFRIDDRFALANFHPVNYMYYGGDTRKVDIQLDPTNGNIRGVVTLHNRVIEQDHDAKDWWIIDLIFEGQSKLVDYRREFATEMGKNNNSVEKLISYIEKSTKVYEGKVLFPENEK